MQSGHILITGTILVLIQGRQWLSVQLIKKAELYALSLSLQFSTKYSQLVIKQVKSFLPKAVQNNPMIFPTDEEVNKGEFTNDVGDAVNI